MTKKVLVVAYYFPPLATSGALRPLSFSRHLPLYGWSPEVLTAEPGSLYPEVPIDHSIRALPSNFRVHRVPDRNPLPALIKLRNRLTARVRPLIKRRRCGESSIQQQRVPEVSRSPFSGFKDRLLEAGFEFPDKQCFWLSRAVKAVSELGMSPRPNVVFATGGPWTALLVGQRVATLLNVPFVADFRDPWTVNPFREQPIKWLRRKAEALERSVCEKAAAVIANTDELCESFRQRYPELGMKFHVITNGYEVESQVHDCENAGVGRARRPLVLTHFGTVYGKRSPTNLLQAIELLSRDGAVSSEILRLRFVGTWDVSDPVCERSVRYLTDRNILLRDSLIGHKECLLQMRSADILLAIQPASPLQIPGKIYEYISAKRPILVIGGEGATANLVKRWALGQCCPNSIDSIRSTIVRLATQQEQLEPPQSAGTQEFNYRSLTGRLATILDTTCATAHA